MIIPTENYSKCLNCPHVYDDDEGMYCSLDVCMHRAADKRKKLGCSTMNTQTTGSHYVLNHTDESGNAHRLTLNGEEIITTACPVCRESHDLSLDDFIKYLQFGDIFSTQIYCRECSSETTKSVLDEEVAKFEQGKPTPILAAVYLDGDTFTVKADSDLTQAELTKAVQICEILNGQDTN
jgi:hypothetical protein